MDAHIHSDDTTKPMMMCFIGMLLFAMVTESEAQLSENYYSSSCPKVERIVQQAVTTKFQQTPITAAATLRLFFHDCFVEGCDASVLIASENNDAEKDAPDNKSLAGDGFDTVIKAKAAVESKCPGVVSCADVLALAARDVVALVGGPKFKVELGRRDGLISKASRVTGKLPEPGLDLKGLVNNFASKGFSLADMIALSGAHTIGFSHCNRFSNRLYNFSSVNPVDPTLDPTYAQELIRACSNPDPDFVVGIDQATEFAFDNLYYQNLVERKGLLTSDQVLFDDVLSQSTVMRFANNAGEFYDAFVSAMRKLGRLGVKVGKEGEIRRDCTAFNK